MTAFEIQNPHPEPAAAADGDSEDNESFEIDSDVSEADLLEYRNLLRQFEPEKVTRELADSTRAIQESMIKKWTTYVPDSPLPPAHSVAR